MGKYLQEMIYRVDPGSKKARHPLLFLSSRRCVTSPAGQHKRGPFGSPFHGRRGERCSDICVGPGTMYRYVHMNNTTRNMYISLCTGTYKIMYKNVDHVTTSTVFGGASHQF